MATLDWFISLTTNPRAVALGRWLLTSLGRTSLVVTLDVAALWLFYREFQKRFPNNPGSLQSLSVSVIRGVFADNTFSSAGSGLEKLARILSLAGLQSHCHSVIGRVPSTRSPWMRWMIPALNSDVEQYSRSRAGLNAWKLCLYHARVDGVTPFRYWRSLVNRSMKLSRRGTAASVQSPVDSL